MESPLMLQAASQSAGLLAEPLYLHLSITDPEVAHALAEAGEGRELSRIGIYRPIESRRNQAS